MSGTINEEETIVLDLKQVAARTPYSERSLYRVAQDPSSPFRKRCGKWGIVREDLVQWVRDGYAGKPKKSDPDPMPKRGAKRRSVMDRAHEIREAA